MYQYLLFDNFVNNDNWVVPQSIGGMATTLTAKMFQGKVDPAVATATWTATSTDATYSSFTKVGIVGQGDGNGFYVDDVKVKAGSSENATWPANPADVYALGSWSTSKLAGGDTVGPVSQAKSWSLNFDGVSYATVAEGFGLAETTNHSYTLEAWVKPGSVPPATCATDNNACAYQILGRSDGAGNHMGLRYANGQTFEAAVRNSSNTEFTVTSTAIASGAWHHVVQVVDDYAKQLYLYVDGQPVGGSPLSYSGTLKDYSGMSYLIGAANPAAASWKWFMQGRIDEVAVYNRALAASEILNRYTTLEPLTGNELALAGYWDINEGGGSKLNDKSDFVNNGSYYGSSQGWSLDVPYPVASGLSFTVPALPGGIYRLAAKVDSGGVIAESDENNNLLIGARVYIQPDLTLTSVVSPVNVTRDVSFGVETTAQNSYAHPAVSPFRVGIYLSTDSTITTADSLLGYRTINSLAGNASDTATTMVTIPSYSTTTNPPTYALPSGAIHRWALDDTASQTIADSIGSNHGTRGSTVGGDNNDPADATGVKAGALSFDGAASPNGDYVTLGNMGAFPNQGTIEFWMKSADTAAARYALSTRYGSSAGLYFYQTSSGTFKVRLYRDSGGTYNERTFIATITAGTWYHIVFAWDKTESRFRGYVNGALVFTSTDNFDFWPSANGFADVRFGAYTTSGYWKGSLDEVVMYDHELVSTEVASRYNSFFDASTSSGFPAGTYYIGAIVDDLNAVSEANETNNARAAETAGTPVPVTVAALQITITKGGNSGGGGLGAFELLFGVLAMLGRMVYGRRMVGIRM